MPTNSWGHTFGVSTSRECALGRLRRTFYSYPFLSLSLVDQWHATMWPLGGHPSKTMTKPLQKDNVTSFFGDTKTLSLSIFLGTTGLGEYFSRYFSKHWEQRKQRKQKEKKTLFFFQFSKKNRYPERMGEPKASGISYSHKKIQREVEESKWFFFTYFICLRSRTRGRKESSMKD